jgi:hypothetical protein
MPLSQNDPQVLQGAEKEFRSAFERLQSGKTAIVPPDTPVSQNNVAREAGRDPSALKKSRYPKLVRDIQMWLVAHPTEPSDTTLESAAESKRRNRSLRDALSIMKKERDAALSMLVEADTLILELQTQLKSLADSPRDERK